MVFVFGPTNSTLDEGLEVEISQKLDLESGFLSTRIRHLNARTSSAKLATQGAFGMFDEQTRIASVHDVDNLILELRLQKTQGNDDLGRRTSWRFGTLVLRTEHLFESLRSS